MWDSGKEATSHPRYYEETMNSLSPLEQDNDWVFDTVKAPTIAIHNDTMKRRKASSSATLVDDTPENMLSKLTLEDIPTEQPTPSTPSTMRRLTVKRRGSPSQATSPAKRRPSVQRKPSAQRKPLAPDMSFGNSSSTVRQFRRVSDNSPDISPEGSIVGRDENRPPMSETITKEALLGRRAYSKAVDQAFQEIYAQTGSQAKRDVISKAAQAWNALDMDDPEGEFHLLRLILEKVSM